jgi:hypothetical protein
VSLSRTRPCSHSEEWSHAADLVYHVLNRRVGRLLLREKPSDYAAPGPIFPSTPFADHDMMVLLERGPAKLHTRGLETDNVYAGIRRPSDRKRR